MNPNTFPVIILIGRPAAGKSEVIDFLKKTPSPERSERFHIADFEEIDDFIYVWEKFEEDEILAKHGKERVWTTPDYYFKDEFLWDLFIEKINLAYAKKVNEDPKFHDKKTAILEFARGGEKGFEEAFNHLSEEVLKNAAIVYIRVSYEESLRKNRRRAKPGQLHTVLFHSLPDEKMEKIYKVNDWDKLAAKNPEFIEIKGHRVPYAVLQNEPEVTGSPVTLGKALEGTLQKLWGIRSHVENKRG